MDTFVTVPVPIANIPRVALPAADWLYDATVADVATAFTSPEYVYLFFIVDGVPVDPIANIANVSTSFPATGHMPNF